MIFPRSCCRSNASRVVFRLIGSIILAGVLGAGCASLPSIPANVILRDVHNNGYALAFDDSSETLASGGAEGRIRLWRLPYGQELFNWKAHSDSLQGLKFLNQDQELLSAAYDGTLLGGGWFNQSRWKSAGGDLQILRTAHHGIVTSISFSRDGRTHASIGNETDSVVYLLDAQTGTVLKRFQPHEQCGTYVRLSRDGHYLASTSDDANVYIWDLQPLLPERKINKNENVLTLNVYSGD